MTEPRADETSDALYRAQGMGQQIGFGKRPAILIIDMQHDFCDPDAPTTLWPSIQTTYGPNPGAFFIGSQPSHSCLLHSRPGGSRRLKRWFVAFEDAQPRHGQGPNRRKQRC